MEINIKNLEKFLQTDILSTKVKKLEKITRGGTSLNFICQTDKNKYLIKAIKKEQLNRAVRLCDILNELKKHPSIYTAHLKTFNKKCIFEFEDWLILLIEYIDGKKLSHHQLTPKLIDKINDSYKHIANLKLDNLFQKQLENIYLENKDILSNLLSGNKNYIKCKILNSIHALNEKLSTKFVIKRNPQVIHGDASLNNLLKDSNQQVALLDFELIRTGYPVEDWAEFFISSLYQHQIFFFSTTKLKKLILHCNNIFSFTSTDWNYGINLYFLNLINKRLKSQKIFKSIRKDFLFCLNNRKYEVISDLIKSIF